LRSHCAVLPIPIGTQIAPTRYDICDGYIDEEDRPEVVKQWHRIKTDYEPVTFRGVDFEYLAMMEECGAGNSVGLSPVTSKSDFVKIMQHPKLVLAHDWVALAHKTGVHTSEEHLRQLVKHCWQTHVADEVLKAHGLPDLMNRIRVRATAATPAASWFRFSVPEFSAGSGPLPAEQGGQVETGSALAEGLAEDALGGVQAEFAELTRHSVVRLDECTTARVQGRTILDLAVLSNPGTRLGNPVALDERPVLCSLQLEQ